MKKLILAVAVGMIISGCQRQAEAPPTSQPSFSPASDSAAGTSLQENRYDLVVTDSNFGTEELYAQKGEKLIISVRNQLQDPVNISIDELSIRSENIEFGEMVEVEVPTDEVGEFEMYSSLGNQREEGFSALLTIEE